MWPKQKKTETSFALLLVEHRLLFLLLNSGLETLLYRRTVLEANHIAKEPRTRKFAIRITNTQKLSVLKCSERKNYDSSEKLLVVFSAAIQIV